MAPSAWAGTERGELLERLASKGVYLITDSELDRERLLKRLRLALEAGIDVVQFRPKGGADAASYRLGMSIAELCAGRGALLIANDRADLCVATGSHGVHLGQDDLPVTPARRLIGAGRLLGLSVSTLDEASAADRHPDVDYIGIGAIYPTETKPDAEYGGLELLKGARSRVRKPLVAIGGISLERVPDVIQAGADSVAVISAVFRAPDAGRAAEALLKAVARARADGAS
jgi:thiamine-phosphate diphosphorylase